MSNSLGKVNITKYLLGNNKSSNNLKAPNGNIATSINTSSLGAGLSGSISRILAYLLAIFIVIMVILLFINFFITPIFKLRPGSPGIISVPGFDDGTLYWSKTSPGLILNKDLPIASQYFGYTINLDVFVENPLQFSTAPRVFFSRGATRKQTPSGETLLGVLDNYNIAAALLPDTNDLLVSVLNKDNNMESVVIPNIPIQEPFRLTMVVMEQAMEVYVNGFLMKTRTFMAPPKDVKGDIYPAAGIEANVVKVRNLKIWPRLLTVSEIKQAKPSLSTPKQFGAVPMPTSSTGCMTSASSTITQTEKAAERFKKLSVDTVSDNTYKLL